MPDLYIAGTAVVIDQEKEFVKKKTKTVMLREEEKKMKKGIDVES